MLAAMLKPRALATSFAVVPSEPFFQRSGTKRVSVVRSNATATTTPVVEEGRRQHDGIQRLTIVQPDDWHLHLRDGDGLSAVAPLRYLSLNTFNTIPFLALFNSLIWRSYEPKVQHLR